MKVFFKRYWFAFLVLMIAIGVIIGVSACSSSFFSVSENVKHEYIAISQKGKEVQKKLKQNKEKLQVHYSVKEKNSVQADTLFLELFEGMDVMFDTWNKMMDRKHDILIELEELSNKNLTIWLSVIAAICTVLPVTLALHQNHTFEERIKEAKEDMQKLDGKISEKNNKIEQLSNRITVTELLDMSSRNLIVLNNLTELEVRENVLITCDKEVNKAIELIQNNVKQSKVKVQENISKWTDDEKTIIINSYLCMMCIFREMLYRYESEFTGENLMRLQQNRYLVSLSIHRLVNTEKQNPVNLESLSDESVGYVNAIKDLFDKEINKLPPQA